jgi:hypothetical protein
MYKYKYKYKYGFMDPRMSRNANSSLHEEENSIAQAGTTFYKGRNLTGESFTMYPGESISDLREKAGGWNDAIRSVHVGANSRVTLYEDIGFDTRPGIGVLDLNKPGVVYNLVDYHLRCTRPNRYVPNRCDVWATWEDKVSSIKVEQA